MNSSFWIGSKDLQSDAPLIDGRFSHHFQLIHTEKISPLRQKSLCRGQGVQG